jgi:hypothetical protein
MPTEPLPQDSTPPMGLVVLPSGLIVYEFEGAITALGLLLPEATSESAEPENRIGWKDAGGVIREMIFGALAGKFSQIAFLQLLANTVAPRRVEGFITLEAQDETGLGTSLKLDAPLEEAAKTITANAGGAGKRIIGGDGKSDFIQAPGPTIIKLNVGAAELEYPGGSVEATPKAIAHLLGRTPVFAAPIFEDAGNVPGSSAYTAEKATYKCQKRDGTSPAAGTKAPFHWVAIG